MFLRRLRQVHRIGPVRIHDKDFPVIIDVSLVSDFERGGLQSLAQGALGTAGGGHEDGGQ